eukprot:TRINITY_DN21584_c0_g5_i1.p1 TRINITY_DN21584_c0_g5~~TRINITY_DN21584_c0_g5_i1.p1  ORF type:complete len:119 (+),score=9.86 TRINITY_DN21584_c0_g5_i1:477-833(+)
MTIEYVCAQAPKTSNAPRERMQGAFRYSQYASRCTKLCPGTTTQTPPLGSSPKMKPMWEISTIGPFSLVACIFWSPLPIGGNSRPTLVMESSISCSGFSLKFLYHWFLLNMVVCFYLR